MAVARDTSARFWDRIARRYARQPVADEAAYQKKLQITREHLRPDMQMLELGCGTGSTAIAHAPYVKHIRAVDISANMLEIAQAKADAADVHNVSFSRSSIDDLEVADESVDAVLALSILHLLADKDAAIARVHRMLRTGGVFVSNTACLGGTMRYLKIVAPVGRLLGLMPRLGFFTADELRASLMDAGFEIDYDWQPDDGVADFLVARKR